MAKSDLGFIKPDEILIKLDLGLTKSDLVLTKPNRKAYSLI